MHQKKILLIEDHEAIRNALRGILEDAGFKVHTAENWFFANKLADVNKHEYDVLISDNQLGENRNHWGVNLLPRLKRLQSKAKTILISTDIVEDHPADAFVLKSNVGELIQVMQKLLNTEPEP